MRLTQTLPLPWPAGSATGAPQWKPAVSTDALADAAKPVAVGAAALLLTPLGLVLAVILVLTLWPVWILTAPVLGTAWFAEQLTPRAAHPS